MPLLLAAAATSDLAYQAGWYLGIALMFALPLAVIAFFVVSLVKANTRKTTGWIVSCVISGILSVLMVLGAILGTVAIFATKTVDPAKTTAASATTKPVSSKDGAVTLQVPPDWVELPDHNKQAILFAGLEATEQYVMVLLTSKVDYTGDLKGFDELVMRLMAPKLKDAEVSEPEPGKTAAGYPVIRRRIAGDVANVRLVYYLTEVETKDCYYEICTWTLKSHDAAAAPVLKKIADTFTAATDPPDAGAVEGPER